MGLIIAVLIFGFIIFFHELGHFLLAKKNGIRVEEFSLGLGPKLFGFTRGETTYSLHLLPFGGACMMSEDEGQSDDPKAFVNKSVWARIAVVFAGPAFNFILAFLLSLVLIGMIGYDPAVITDVVEGSPAQEAGIQGGDRIVSINGDRILLYREISSYSTLHPTSAAKELDIVYERDGSYYDTTLQPQYDETQGRYMMGVMSNGQRVRGSVLKTVFYSIYEVKYWISLTIDSLRLMITGQVPVSDVSGPVGIVHVIHTTYEESSVVSIRSVIVNMIYIAILISANVGVMNLLPIPALDGGRLVFLILEVIRRKKIDPEKEGRVHVAGLMVLMALMVVVLCKDIYQLFL